MHVLNIVLYDAAVGLFTVREVVGPVCVYVAVGRKDSFVDQFFGVVKQFKEILMNLKSAIGFIIILIDVL